MSLCCLGFFLPFSFMTHLEQDTIPNTVRIVMISLSEKLKFSIISTIGINLLYEESRCQPPGRLDYIIKEQKNEI